MQFQGKKGQERAHGWVWRDRIRAETGRFLRSVSWYIVGGPNPWKNGQVGL
jgi:hypothetical protein